jgi:phosphoserine aminotransferase
LPANESIRSRTSICIKIVDPWFTAFDEDTQKALIKDMTKLIDKEGAGYDLAHYATAPAGFRFWGGATVESSDMKAVLPWVDWAYAEVKAAKQA